MLSEKNLPLYSVNKVSSQATEPQECRYMKLMTDESKGSIVKMMERETIISFTPEEMRSAFTDKDYITIEGYLNNFNGAVALLLKVSIQTNHPQSIYGSLFKDSQFLLKLATGETITLYSGQSDAGTVDIAHAHTHYMTFFPLDEQTMNKLHSAPITKARLHWEKGYEDYPILVSDFFIRQIACVR